MGLQTWMWGAIALCWSSAALGESYSRRLVERPIEKRWDEITSCYEEATKRSDPDPEGRLVMKYRIETSGDVSSVTVTENDTGDGKLAQCVARVFQKLRYDPPPPKPIIVRYPFTFGHDD